MNKDCHHIKPVIFKNKRGLVIELTANMFLAEGQVPILFEDNVEKCAEQVTRFCWNHMVASNRRLLKFESKKQWRDRLYRMLKCMEDILKAIGENNIEKMSIIPHHVLCLIYVKPLALKITAALDILSRQLELLKLNEYELNTLILQSGGGTRRIL